MRDSGLFAEVMEHALASATLVRFRAEGRSMHPTIRDGEEIAAAPVSITEVVRGDVLLCRHAGRVLAHRVVAIAHHHGDRRFELRGDGHTSSDALVGPADVVARIVAVRRGGRSIPLPGGWLARPRAFRNGLDEARDRAGDQRLQIGQAAGHAPLLSR